MKVYYAKTDEHHDMEGVYLRLDNFGTKFSAPWDDFGYIVTFNAELYEDGCSWFLGAIKFLVKNITGLGYKEASHFLRNVGYNDVAIIDRHIIRFLYQYHYIDQLPKIITKKIYLELEDILTKFGILLDKLDLMIWYHMTGTVLK